MSKQESFHKVGDGDVVVGWLDKDDGAYVELEPQWCDENGTPVGDSGDDMVYDGVFVRSKLLEPWSSEDVDDVVYALMHMHNIENDGITKETKWLKLAKRIKNKKEDL